jgi:hypothetical protein
MTDETTPGVLLSSADGSHYFIPAGDLKQYAVSDLPAEVRDGVASAAPQVPAFSVERSAGAKAEGAAAFFPMPEG